MVASFGPRKFMDDNANATKKFDYYNNSDYSSGHAKHLAKCDKCKAVRICEWIGFG